MKKRKLLFFISSLMLIIGLASCGSSNNTANNGNKVENDNNTVVDNDELINVENLNNHDEIEEGYIEGTIMVKYDGSFNETMLSDLNYDDVKPLYKGSKWQKITLSKNVNTLEAYHYLHSLQCFDKVEFDYPMKSDGKIESVDISGNTYAENQNAYLEVQGIKDAWVDLYNNHNVSLGGSSDIIVAVIDTGVDYNHIDLRNNIWINPSEIPNNGVDDDGNGYIDDVRGWDFVGEDNDPNDDNGHGTHVAGIIAAENNDVGTVGVAFNCKVMCLKAGMASGYFNSSDVAAAIQYAYMNGASVINMSFGGITLSSVVEDSLKDAYNQCVLVAAAGNNNYCNNSSCLEHYPDVGASYPAALPYVIGVMSCDISGSYKSYFSNFDHYLYNNVEYEVYACGENIPSTFPNNRYASLSGTSMSSPVVAGIAALARSKFKDRDLYSNKFIQSQIVNQHSSYHICTNAYDALNGIPTPYIYSLYDFYCFDDEDFDLNNNGDRLINAGETICLGLEFMNWGGMASDITISFDTKTMSGGKDPYITLLNNSISIPDIGTYSLGDAGKIYRDGKCVGVENGIFIKVSDNAPDQYVAGINFVVRYKNGLDNKDTKIYESSLQTLLINIDNGYVLPEVINEDTVYKNDRKYIVNTNVTITEGVTVTFEEGCTIEYYGSFRDDYISSYNTLSFNVYGELYFNGSIEKMINIGPSERFDNYAITAYCMNENALIRFDYCNITNLHNFEDTDSNISMYNSYYLASSRVIDIDRLELIIYKKAGSLVSYFPRMSFDIIENSILDFSNNNYFYFHVNELLNSVVIRNEAGGDFYVDHNASNNLFCLETSEMVNSSHIYLADKYSYVDDYIVNNTFINLEYMYYEPLIKVDFRKKVFNSGNIVEGVLALYPSKFVETYYGSDGTPIVDLTDYNNNDPNLIWPYIKNIEIYNDNNEIVSVVDDSQFIVKVTFSRKLDTSKEFYLYYGSRLPYSDYKINGEFISDTEWIGTLHVQATIEGGSNYFSIGGSKINAKDDGFKKLINNAPSFKFTIDLTQAHSMAIQATPSNEGVNLEWVQDDYDTLMGYNVYRSDSKDGNYVKLNTVVIPSNENTFLDENAEPGKTYWYTFTVVLSDMSESNPAGKVVATMLDTEKPSIYHTPVNQGYLNNNLVIYCTASDNVGIQNVILYYRVKGTTTWKTLTMSKQNDKYSATIFGSELSLDGLEYYIVASDGVNTITKGTDETPYSVVIKDSSALMNIGDVDGDGIITTKDALMIIQSINGDLLLTDDQFKRADLNKDNTLSSVEALRILQYINGNVITLEM